MAASGVIQQIDQLTAGTLSPYQRDLYLAGRLRCEFVSYRLVGRTGFRPERIGALCTEVRLLNGTKN